MNPRFEQFVRDEIRAVSNRHGLGILLRTDFGSKMSEDDGEGVRYILDNDVEIYIEYDMSTFTFNVTIFDGDETYE